MNTKKILMVAFSVLFASLLVVGCSSDDDPPAVAGDSGSTPPEDTGGGSTPPEDNGDDESSTDTSRIQGDWVSQCYGAAGDDGGGTAIALVFREKEFRFAQGSFANDSCDQDPEKESKFEGEYVFGKAITTSSGLSANELDLKPKNEGTLKTIVAVDGKKMTINFGNGKERPSDFSDQASTWDLQKAGSDGSSGSSGSSGTGSGRDCEPCKSQSDCGGGTECATFGKGDAAETLCALPETQECPVGGV